MARVLLGVLLESVEALHRGRSEDPVDLVLWEPTLVDPPRAAAARRLRDRVAAAHPRASTVPYAWCLVSHDSGDPLRGRGSRSVSGADERLGHLQDTDEVERAWAVTRTCADAFGAVRVALRTPPSFAGALGRRRLNAFAGRRKLEPNPLVWEPEGLWTPALAAAAAREAGVELLLPGFVGGRWALHPTEAPGAWARIDGASASGAPLGPGHVEELVGAVADRGGPATLVFAGPRAYTHLRAFAAEAGLLGP